MILLITDDAITESNIFINHLFISSYCLKFSYKRQKAKNGRIICILVRLSYVKSYKPVIDRVYFYKNDMKKIGI